MMTLSLFLAFPEAVHVSPTQAPSFPLLKQAYRMDQKHKFQVFVGNVNSQTTDEKLRSVFEVSSSSRIADADAEQCCVGLGLEAVVGRYGRAQFETVKHHIPSPD